MLRDMDDKGRMRRVKKLDRPEEFEAVWRDRFTEEERAAIVAAIDARLDALVAAPEKQWGAIMGAAAEVGKVNPFAGKPGDWSGTPWEPIWLARGRSDRQAMQFFGELWRWRVVEHAQDWIGVRNRPDARPTVPGRGVTLEGRTYFLAKGM